MEKSAPPATVFLCHSSQDKGFVKRLALDLKRRSIAVWFDAWEIGVGDSITEKVGNAIQDSGWLAVVLTRNSVASSWVQRELSSALMREFEEKRVFILPIVAEACAIPILLRDKKYADFRKNYDQGLFDLLSVVSPTLQAREVDLEQDELRRLLLPAVREGMPVREGDLRAVQQTLRSLQDRLGVSRTRFSAIQAGDPLTAGLLNELAEAAVELGMKLSVPVRLREFPVTSGDVVTEGLFKDLYGTVNQLVWSLLRATYTPTQQGKS
jgi:hypothetical protein